MSNSKRSLFRVPLFAVLILVAATSLPLSWLARQFQYLRQEQATANWVRRMGGSVNTEAASDGKPVLWNGERTGWWRSQFESLGFQPVYRVDLSGTQVDDISTLTCLDDLYVLNLSKTNVSDISMVREYPRLRFLAIDETRVDDLTPVARLKNLETIVLSGVQTTELSPLFKLNKLETVFLLGGDVNERQVRRLKKSLPQCVVIE